MLLLVPSQASALSVAPCGKEHGVSTTLVVPSSNFDSELAYRAPAASAYAGSPLALLDSSTRGKVLTAFARRFDADAHPGAVMEDAVAGEQDDGSKRARHMAPYDWQRDGKRVACKNAQLSWGKATSRWALHFANIRQDATDELLLAVYAPEGVHLFRSNGMLALGRTGKATVAKGRRVTLLGPLNEPDWRVALHEILMKLNSRATPLTLAGNDDPRLAPLIKSATLPFTSSLYFGVPLADCSGAARAAVVTSIVRRLDEAWLHPGAVTTDAVPGKNINGKLPGKTIVAYDWQRDGKRVSCNVAQLGWKGGNDPVWRLQFSGVQTATHDELLLAAYTPDGVHLFRHDGKSGLCSTGERTALTGEQIQYYSSRHERDWRVALAEILGKMEANGCLRLAFLPWGAQAVEATHSSLV